MSGLYQVQTHHSPTSCLFWQRRPLLSECAGLCWPSTSGYSRGSSPPSAPPAYAGPAKAAAQSTQGGRPLAQTHPYSDQAERRRMKRMLPRGFVEYLFPFG